MVALGVHGDGLFTTRNDRERWYQILKNRVLLENYSLPGDLEPQIGAFIDRYNDQN